LRLVLIEGFLRHKLSAEVLHLKSELSFDGLIFFPHDITPNNIELVENLRNASFRHLTIKSRLEFFNFLDRFCWNPLVGVRHILVFGFSFADFGFNPESVTDVSNALLGQVFSCPHDLNILEVLVIGGLFQKHDQLFVVCLHVVELNMD